MQIPRITKWGWQAKVQPKRSKERQASGTTSEDNCRNVANET